MENPKTLPDIESIDFSCDLQIRYSDIDGYNHVNNGIFFSYFEHARALFLHEVCHWKIMEVGTVVGKITLDYLRPILLTDKIKCYVECSRIGTSSFDLDQYIIGVTEKGEKYSYAISRTVMVSVDMKTMRPIPIPEIYRVKLEKGQ